VSGYGLGLDVVDVSDEVDDDDIEEGKNVNEKNLDMMESEKCVFFFF
jgi:hypothetical protein